MEESSTSCNEEEPDQFFDASEQSQPSTSDPTLSHLKPSTYDQSTDTHKPQNFPEYSPPSKLRRRKSVLKTNRASDDSTVIHGTSSSAYDDDVTSSFTERKYKKYRSFKGHLRKIDNNKMASRGEISATSNDLVDDVDVVDGSATGVEHEETQPSDFLVYLAGLMIKAIGFQVKLLFNIFTFPIWSMYRVYMFVIDPFGTVRHARGYFMGMLLRFWAVVCDNVSPSLYKWLKEQKSVWKMVMQFGWGFLLAGYVGFVLCSLLVSAFVISGLVIRHVVEEPVQIKETLNFDYTKNSPVAFVPIISCPHITLGTNYRDKIDFGEDTRLHVIPPNHKLQVSVSLTLPESEYNQHLGVFQVRVDFLSAKWERIRSLHHLCMLHYKSLPIRLLSTFIKAAPLMTGYSSESQTLNVEMRGFTEGNVPTVCLRVMIEQRAEFRPGAGIPELYAASLLIESELPLFKRLIWSWKNTLFVWIALVVFMMELLFALLCCRPIIMPRVRRTENAPSRRNTILSPVQASKSEFLLHNAWSEAQCTE